jgi:hypothetical protein
MYFNNKLVLYIINKATAFQAAKFLKNISIKTTWNTLQVCWINIYQDPSDIVVSDTSKNFISEKFQQHVIIININIKKVPVEAHNNISKIEQYHGLLQQAYKILSKKLLLLLIKKKVILQMTVKAVNNSAGPDRIVSTLLVFKAYF